MASGRRRRSSMIEVPPGAKMVPMTPARAKVGRVGPFTLIGQLAWAIPGAASATLLQATAADIDPAHKVGVYTAFAVVGAITSMLGTIVGGTLSDRTRS